jgi:Flp pilus assembly pilin Flp
MPHTHPRRFDLRSEDGQTMTEYGVLLALVAVVVIATLIVFGNTILGLWQSFDNALP